MPIRLAQVGTLGYDPAHAKYPRTVVEFQHFSLMRRPAPAIWSVSGGPDVLNARPVFRPVISRIPHKQTNLC